jgi:hypothetical protein
MARRSGQRAWLLASGGATLLVLGCVLAVTLAPPGAAASVSYAEARGRWAARPFASYRLVVQDGYCTYDVLVRGERVFGRQRDSCKTQMHSVTGLFTIIERDRQVTPNCGLRDCPCEAVTRVHASYHPHLGYPINIEIAVTTRPRWNAPDTWRSVLANMALPRCDADNRRDLRVVALEPIADNR